MSTTSSVKCVSRSEEIITSTPVKNTAQQKSSKRHQSPLHQDSNNKKAKLIKVIFMHPPY